MASCEPSLAHWLSMISPRNVLSLGAARPTLRNRTDTPIATAIFFMTRSPFVFVTPGICCGDRSSCRTSRFRKNLFQAAVKPRTHRQGNLERFHVRNDLQHFSGGIKDHMAATAARHMLFQGLAKLRGAVAVNVAGHICQYFLAIHRRHRRFLSAPPRASAASPPPSQHPPQYVALFS